mgnify:FL=1
MCLGKATKLCDILSEKDKTYEATLLLGTETNTQDTTGEVLSQASEEDLKKLTEDQVFKTVKGYIGEYDQIPPMFSAIKIGGEKLYNLQEEAK